MSLNVLARLQNYAEPALYIIVALYGVLLVILEAVTFQTSPLELLNRAKVKQRVFEKFWNRLNKQFYAKESTTPLPSLMSAVSGTVLEIGPGSGNQLPRYTASQITKIYGVEPNTSLHPELRENVRKLGLEEKYVLVGCGIEDVEGLRRAGVPDQGVDTAVVVNVLCSVPDPQSVCNGVYRVLKKGGVAIIFEHVASTDLISRVVQDIYNLLWPHLLGNCHLTRPTRRYLLAAGEWERVELEAPKPEDAETCLPRVKGRLVK